MLDVLFKFPIVMIDGDMEENKHRLALPNEDDVDMIIGEAEVPYHDFLGIIDRWLPSDESREKASRGEFDACYVMFLSSGSYLVPWPKEYFKTQITKFAQEYVTRNPPSSEITTKKQMRELYDNLPEE